MANGNGFKATAIVSDLVAEGHENRLLRLEESVQTLASGVAEVSVQQKIMNGQLETSTNTILKKLDDLHSKVEHFDERIDPLEISENHRKRISGFYKTILVAVATTLVAGLITWFLNKTLGA